MMANHVEKKMTEEMETESISRMVTMSMAPSSLCGIGYSKQTYKKVGDYLSPKPQTLSLKP